MQKTTLMDQPRPKKKTKIFDGWTDPSIPTLVYPSTENKIRKLRKFKNKKWVDASTVILRKIDGSSGSKLCAHESNNGWKSESQKTEAERTKIWEFDGSTRHRQKNSSINQTQSFWLWKILQKKQSQKDPKIWWINWQSHFSLLSSARLMDHLKRSDWMSRSPDPGCGNGRAENISRARALYKIFSRTTTEDVPRGAVPVPRGTVCKLPLLCCAGSLKLPCGTRTFSSLLAPDLRGEFVSLGSPVGGLCVTWMSHHVSVRVSRVLWWVV